MKCFYTLSCVFLFLLGVSSDMLIAQDACFRNDTIPIIDFNEGDEGISLPDTTRISLEISDITNNDLSDPSQGLATVYLGFQHASIIDIEMNLISPSGQKVTLVGPTAPSKSNYTGGVDWNIKLVDPSQPTDKDQGISDDRWNSNASWNLATSPTGTYYPRQSLEGFNSGAIKGEWTLEIIDVLDFDNEFIQGKPRSFVYRFGLGFKNTAGLECFECISINSRLDNENVEGCEGSKGLNIDVKSALAVANPKYEYGLVVSKNDTIVEIIDTKSAMNNTNTINMQTYEQGTYEVTGLSYYNLRDGQVKSAKLKSQLSSMIASSQLCGKLSSNSFVVTINPPIIKEEKKDTVCYSPQGYEWYGIFLTESGSYQQSLNEGLCDTLVRLELTVKKSNLTVTPSATQFSCDVEEITLIPEGAQGLEPTWETTTGNIVQRISDGSILVDTAGTYTLKYTFEGCDVVEDVVIPEGGDYIDLTTDKADFQCKSSVLTASAKGANIEWFDLGGNSLGTNSILTVLASGKYVAKATRAGCEKSDTIEVVNPLDVVKVEGMTDQSLTCQDSIVEAKITGLDTKKYNLTWSRNDEEFSTKTAENLNMAGKYVVKISNTKEECEERTIKFTITDKKEYPQRFVVGINDSLGCTRDAKLSALVLPLGIEAVWKDASGNEVPSENGVITVKKEGVYTAEASTPQGCIERKSILVERVKGISHLVDYDPFISLDCTDKNRNILSSPSSGISYEWTFPLGTKESGNPTIKELGTYTFVATDIGKQGQPGSGCTLMGSVEVVIDENTMKKIVYPAGTVTCTNDTLLVSPDKNQDHGYNYSWEMNPKIVATNGSSIEVMDQDTFVVNVSDGNGCDATYLVPISIDTTNTLKSISADTLTCMKEEAQINVDPGKYTIAEFSWGTAPNSPPGDIKDVTMISPIATKATNYRLIFRYEENGCQGDTTIAVLKEQAIPSFIEFNNGKDTITCDQTLEATFDAGISADSILSYTLKLGTEVIASSDKVVDRIIKAQFTKAGKYTFEITGLGNCMNTKEFTIAQDTVAPTFVLAADSIKCNNLNPLLSASDIVNGHKLQWADVAGNNLADTAIAKVSQLGKYYFTAIDTTNNCKRTESIEVGDARVYPSNYGITPDTLLTCEKDTVYPVVTPFELSTKVAWFDDQGGSISEDRYAEISDPKRYYIYVLTNDQGCETRDSMYLDIDTIRPNIVLDTSGYLTCTDTVQKIFLSGRGDLWELSWDDNIDASQDTLFLRDDDVHKLVVKDRRNSCVDSSFISLAFDTTKISVQNIYHDTLVCSGKAARIHVESNEEIKRFEWLGPNGFVSDEKLPVIVDGGMYTVKIYGSNGCPRDTFLNVDDSRKFPTVKAKDVYVRCDKEPTTFEIDTLIGIDRVVWIGEEYKEEGFDATTSEPGEYRVVGFNAQGCRSVDTFMVINEIYPPTFTKRADTLYCDGASLYAEGIDDGETVLWTGPGIDNETDPTIRVDSAGTYTLVVTSRFGCSDTTQLMPVDARNRPSASIDQKNTWQCATKEVALSAQTPGDTSLLSYIWTTASGTFLGDTTGRTVVVGDTGEYYLTVIDTFTKCSSFIPFQLKAEPPSFTAFEALAKAPSCEGYGDGSIVISNLNGQYPPYTTFIDSVSYGGIDSITSLKPGAYFVEIIDSLGCKVQDTVVVEEPNDPVLELASDTTLVFGTELSLNPFKNIDLTTIKTKKWSPNVNCDGCDSLTMKATRDMVITVQVVSKNGCADEKTMLLKVYQANYLFPNIFNPNSPNEENRIFFIPENAGFKSIEEVSIYNHWGNLVFQKFGVGQGGKAVNWDGTFNGQKAESGTYVVIVKATLINDEKKVYKGPLTLIR